MSSLLVSCVSSHCMSLLHLQHIHQNTGEMRESDSPNKKKCLPIYTGAGATYNRQERCTDLCINDHLQRSIKKKHKKATLPPLLSFLPFLPLSLHTLRTVKRCAHSSLHRDFKEKRKKKNRKCRQDKSKSKTRTSFWHRNTKQSSLNIEIRTRGSQRTTKSTTETTPEQPPTAGRAPKQQRSVLHAAR